MDDRKLETTNRVASIDVYRGMVMFLMLAEVLHLEKIRKVFDGDTTVGKIADWIRFHVTHVEWTGCSLHDMIQPSFTFLVGVSMVFSIAMRESKGQSRREILLHALGRSLTLVFLGIFLRSLGKPSTNFTFDDTLTQIGLGYWIAFLVSSLSTRWLVCVLAVLLSGYWLAFILYPGPTSDFSYSSVGVPNDWPHHWKEGFLTHFNKNSNLAWAFDRWWMNLFPREKPFEFSGGGYATLSFIPTLGTMIIGLLAGRTLQSDWSWSKKFLLLVAGGVVMMAFAYGLERAGICPIVKRIWTPAWTIWSGGICFLWLAFLGYLCDQVGWTRWAFPFLVVGANSIVAYVMSWTMEKWTIDALQRHFGSTIRLCSNQIASIVGVDPAKGDFVNNLLLGLLTLVVFWIVLLWLYRRRIFVRI